MKKFIYAIIALALFTGLLGAGGFLWGMNQFKSPGPLKNQAIVLIEPGSSLRAIADQLQAADVLNDKNYHPFILGVRFQGQASKLQAGEYQFIPNISPRDVANKLEAGDVHQRRFTIAEGLTSWEITTLINNVPALTGTIDDIADEGSLLPETYQYTYRDSRRAQIDKMRLSMSQTIAELWEARQPDLPISTPEEAIILASIVEKETGVAEERAKVAGVFINRLNKGMALQSDPTVIYALTQGRGALGRPLNRLDLKLDSPYNTYQYPGLPPGPIANPGSDSLKAVLNPEEHDFFYFVADGSGGHAFAKTLKGHNRNVAAWRKFKKQATQKSGKN